MSFKKDTCRSGNNKELNLNEKQVPFLNGRLSGLSVGLSQLSALTYFHKESCVSFHAVIRSL